MGEKINDNQINLRELLANFKNVALAINRHLVKEAETYKNIALTVNKHATTISGVYKQIALTINSHRTEILEICNYLTSTMSNANRALLKLSEQMELIINVLKPVLLEALEQYSTIGNSPDFEDFYEDEGLQDSINNTFIYLDNSNTIYQNENDYVEKTTKSFSFLIIILAGFINFISNLVVIFGSPFDNTQKEILERLNNIAETVMLNEEISDTQFQQSEIIIHVIQSVEMLCECTNIQMEVE